MKCVAWWTAGGTTYD